MKTTDRKECNCINLDHLVHKTTQHLEQTSLMHSGIQTYLKSVGCIPQLTAFSSHWHTDRFCYHGNIIQTVPPRHIWNYINDWDGSVKKFLRCICWRWFAFSLLVQLETVYIYIHIRPARVSIGPILLRPLNPHEFRIVGNG